MLLDYYARACVHLYRQTTNDGEGGYKTEWCEGMKFTNYQALNTSTEAQIAERQGISTLYGVLVNRDVPLGYGDYYKDTESGQMFRITSEPSESHTPDNSNLNLKYFSSEREVLPR